MRGAYLFLQLLNYIPVNFRAYWMKYIAEILTSVLKRKVDALQLLPVESEFANASHILNDLLGVPSHSLLWMSSLQEGHPHTLFLSPPINNCLTCGSLLLTHNAPSTVICYTQSGPLLAAKITLRCESCDINYR